MRAEGSGADWCVMANDCKLSNGLMVLSNVSSQWVMCCDLFNHTSDRDQSVWHLKPSCPSEPSFLQPTHWVLCCRDEMATDKSLIKPPPEVSAVITIPSGTGRDRGCTAGPKTGAEDALPAPRLHLIRICQILPIRSRQWLGWKRSINARLL